MKNFIINTDGASRGNPGNAAAAYLIQTKDGVIWFEEGRYLGKTTNNEAEYQALILSFEKLIKDFSTDLPSSVEVRSDSQLLVNQMSGRFKIKNQNLQVLYLKAKESEKKIGKVIYTYIPREKNFLADKIANRVLDETL